MSWRFFSLELHHAEDYPELVAQPRSIPSMRVALLVRNELGEGAAGRFFEAIGARMHDRDEQIRFPATIEGALVDAGLDPAFCSKGLDDDATLTRLVAEHRALSDRGFGVPTIALDREDGPAMLGPVLARLPSDAEAVELFDHVAWIVRNPNIYELKRERTELPDLEGLRLAQIRRAARQEVAEL